MGTITAIRRGRLNRRNSLVGLALAALLTVAACGGDDAADDDTDPAGPSDTPAPTAAPSDDEGATNEEPIKIGAILSLSGAYSSIGEDAELALRAFKTTNPTVDGRPVEFVIENDQSDPTTGAAVARRMVDDDEIVAIIGPNVGAVLVPTYPILKEATKPVMIITPVPYPNYNQEPYLFGPNLHPIPVQADDFVQYADALGLENMVVITNDDATGAALTPVYEGLGLKVETVPLSVTDYTPVLTGMRSDGVDALLMVAGSGEAAGHMLRGKQEIGWDVETFLPASQFNATFMELGGDAVIGVRGFIQTAAIDPEDLASAEEQEVARTVQAAVDAATPGAKVYLHSNLPYSWDHAYSLLLAMQEAGSTDGAVLRDILETQTFNGAGGTVARSATDHVGWQRESARRAIINENKEIVLAEDA